MLAWPYTTYPGNGARRRYTMIWGVAFSVDGCKRQSTGLTGDRHTAARFGRSATGSKVVG